MVAVALVPGGDGVDAAVSSVRDARIFDSAAVISVSDLLSNFI